MKLPPLAVAVPLCLPCLHAQEPKVDASLFQFRAGFEGAPPGAMHVAVGFVGDAEPVVLCAGDGGSGQPITPLSLLPLQALAKVLAADALHQQQRGNLDQGSGVSFGGNELPLRELLQGSPLLPDYFVLDGDGPAVDKATLARCGEIAAGSGARYLATAQGAAEFALLEAKTLAGRTADWPSMLRVQLAAHVPGLDPFAADALSDAERARVAVPADAATALAAAQPSLYRVLISAKNLAAWWQWRVKSGLPLWDGPRMGRQVGVPGQAGETRWYFTSSGPTFVLVANVYPGRSAGFVYVGPVRGSRAQLVQKGFETDLYGASDGRTAAGGAVAVAAPVGLVPAGGVSLAGTRWRTRPGAGGEVALQLHVEAAKRDGVSVTADGVTRRSTQFQRSGETWQLLAPASGSVTALRMWLWAQPAAAPERIEAVVVRMRGRGAVVPEVLELVPDKQ